VATATLKIRPPGVPGPAAAPAAVPGAKPAPNKEATATLKIRMPTEGSPGTAAAPSAPSAPTSPAAAPEASKDVTAVLKVRPGGVGARPAPGPAPEPDAGATVRIRPPAPAVPKPPSAVSADDETQVGVQAPPAAPPAPGERPKMSLKLKQGDGAKPAKRDVTIPGLGEKQASVPAETAEAAMTVAVTPMAAAAGSAEGEDPAAATVVMAPDDEAATADKKKSLRIKAGKGKEEATPVGAADAAEAQDELGLPVSTLAGTAGPGRLAAAAALLAFAGVGALLIRLLLDFRRYL
jgi:hypothetical protein